MTIASSRPSAHGRRRRPRMSGRGCADAQPSDGAHARACGAGPSRPGGSRSGSDLDLPRRRGLRRPRARPRRLASRRAGHVALRLWLPDLEARAGARRGAAGHGPRLAPLLLLPHRAVPGHQGAAWIDDVARPRRRVPGRRLQVASRTIWRDSWTNSSGARLR